MWSEPQRRREREERLIFLHFLHNFLSISSLKTLVCRMCRVCFPWTGYETCQNKKKNEKRRERERVTLLPPSCAVLQNDGIIIQKNLLPYFFHLFYPGVPGTLSYYYNQNTWTAHTGYPLWRRERRKHKCSFCKVHLTLFLSWIMLNWCSCEKVHGRLWLRFSDE